MCIFQSCTTPAPLSGDDVCQKERDTIDYSIKITKEMAGSGNGQYLFFQSTHSLIWSYIIRTTSIVAMQLKSKGHVKRQKCEQNLRSGCHHCFLDDFVHYLYTLVSNQMSNIYCKIFHHIICWKSSFSKTWIFAVVLVLLYMVQ